MCSSQESVKRIQNYLETRKYMRYTFFPTLHCRKIMTEDKSIFFRMNSNYNRNSHTNREYKIITYNMNIICVLNHKQLFLQNKIERGKLILSQYQNPTCHKNTQINHVNLLYDHIKQISKLTHYAIKHQYKIYISNKTMTRFILKT